MVHIVFFFPLKIYNKNTWNLIGISIHWAITEPKQDKSVKYGPSCGGRRLCSTKQRETTTWLGTIISCCLVFWFRRLADLETKQIKKIKLNIQLPRFVCPFFLFSFLSYNQMRTWGRALGDRVRCSADRRPADAGVPWGDREMDFEPTTGATRTVGGRPGVHSTWLKSNFYSEKTKI